MHWTSLYLSLEAIDLPNTGIFLIQDHEEERTGTEQLDPLVRSSEKDI